MADGKSAALAAAAPPALSPIEEIIAEARAGRMFILADDEARENEGDLIIPATFADAGAINFMAKHGRGLICLALPRARVETLGLAPMTSQNGARHHTAFTVSIEAKEGVTTGISAADRARTIAVAIDPGAGATDIVTPGHVFPLIARDGGVLIRAGHTEAAVDIARLAGLPPAGVICEIMNEDGSMARLPDLLLFAQRHGIKVGTIADLIAYRRRTETLVTRTLSCPFESAYGGGFTLHLYRSEIGPVEHVALVRGEVTGETPVLVRMHALNVLEDVLGDRAHQRGGELQAAMRMIADAGRGVVVLLREGQPTALSLRLRERAGAAGESTATDEAAQETLGQAFRDYGIGAQILRDLGVRRMILLSNSLKTVPGLDGFGLEILDRRPIAIR